LRKETAIGCVAFVLCIGALSLHWMRTWQANRGFSAAGAKLVVFGPSSWDAFAPGAAETVVSQVTAALDQKFQLVHPELKNIVHDSRGTVADGLARLRNAQVAGDQLDVVICAANPVNTVYARAGLIAPLDSLVTGMKQRFTQDAIENFNVDGHLWAAPLSAVNLTTFIYNRDLFAKIGAEPPTTYAEFQTLVPKFKAIGIIPVVHQGKNSWMWLLYYMSALAQVTNNNQVSLVAGLLEGREKFTGSVNLRALQLARNWVDDGLLDPQSNELDEDAMRSVFYSGRAAAYFGATWDLPGIAANAPFNWSVFPFPKYLSEPGRSQSFGGAESGLCVAANTRQPDLAKAYIEFATRDDNAKELLAPLKAFATSHRNVSGVDDAISRTLRAQLPAAKFLDWIFPPELTELMQREIQAMMGLSQSPEQTAANIQEKYASLVKAGYRYRATQITSKEVPQ
jgi:raffinose/stachyose/melibiose transport system substrate-binding protein